MRALLGFSYLVHYTRDPQSPPRSAKISVVLLSRRLAFLTKWASCGQMKTFDALGKDEVALSLYGLSGAGTRKNNLWEGRAELLSWWLPL